MVSFITFLSSFLILLIWALSQLFLMSLAKGLSILFTFSKNQLLVSLTFSIIFFVYISFTSALIFMISLLLLTLDFVCSFSNCFRYKGQVMLFRWFNRFFLFPEVRLYCYKLPSLNCLCCVPQILDHCVFIFMSQGIFFPFPLWYLQWSIGCLVAHF